MIMFVWRAPLLASMAVAVMSLAACSRIYEGRYAATFTTEVTLTASSSVDTITGSESLEFLEGSLENNEVLLSRTFDAPCVLRGTKRGGFGLAFPGGETCAREEQSFVLVNGGAVNVRSDDLAIELEWTLIDDEGVIAGSATETVVVDMRQRIE